MYVKYLNLIMDCLMNASIWSHGNISRQILLIAYLTFIVIPMFVAGIALFIFEVIYQEYLLFKITCKSSFCGLKTSLHLLYVNSITLFAQKSITYIDYLALKVLLPLREKIRNKALKEIEKIGNKYGKLEPRD